MAFQRQKGHGLFLLLWDSKKLFYLGILFVFAVTPLRQKKTNSKVSNLSFSVAEWPVFKLGIGNFKRLYSHSTFDSISSDCIQFNFRLQCFGKIRKFLQIPPIRKLCPFSLRVHRHWAYHGNYQLRFDFGHAELKSDIFLHYFTR